MRIGGATWSYIDERFVDFSLNISNNSDDYIFEKVKFYFAITNRYGTKVFARTFTIELEVEIDIVMTQKNYTSIKTSPR